jgi:hypothetical protein
LWTLSFQYSLEDSSASTNLSRPLHPLKQHTSIRRYIGYFFEDQLLRSLRTRLSDVKTHGLEITSIEAHQKEGGVFINFSYSAQDEQAALKEIEKDLNAEAGKKGGAPSWCFRPGKVWLVQGTPWKEVRQCILVYSESHVHTES